EFFMARTTRIRIGIEGQFWQPVHENFIDPTATNSSRWNSIKRDSSTVTPPGGGVGSLINEYANSWASAGLKWTILGTTPCFRLYSDAPLRISSNFMMSFTKSRRVIEQYTR